MGPKVKIDLVTCRALGCQRRRVRPGASHWKEHAVEWYAIEADQRAMKSRTTAMLPKELAALKARRDAMGMIWPPRNFRQ